MRINRETLLTIILLVFLAVLTVAGVLAGAETGAARPLDSASTGPDGALALYEWLESLNYAVSDTVGATFSIPEGADLALVLEPADLAPAELDEIERFAEAGGRVIFAGENFGSTALLSHFEVRRTYALEQADSTAPLLPVFNDPALQQALPFAPTSFLDPEFDEFLPLAAVPEGPVVLQVQIGDGTLILSALTDPFTNAGLKTPGAGAFVLNLLDGLPDGAGIWFDEWHHGRRVNVLTPSGPGDWLRRTPGGRAVLFSAIAIFTWIALSGRAFGKAVRPQELQARRAPLEYVTAIAELNQRAGNRAHLMSHYHHRLKRRLAARYRIDPALPDDRFVETLNRFDPDLDAAALAAQLAGLRETDVSEAEMVKRVSDSAIQRFSDSATPRPGKSRTR